MLRILSLLRNHVKLFALKRPEVYDAIIWLLSRPIIANNPLYKATVMNRALKFDKAHGADIPPIFIETTVNCNARCVMCLHGYQDIKGTMSMDLFERILEECGKSGVRTVGLSVFGEPLVDRDFVRRVRLLRAANMEYFFSTNGYLFSEVIANELLSLGGLSRINFSVNAFSNEVYAKVMRGLDRDRVYKNISTFLALKTQLRLNTPRVSISCCKTNLVARELKQFNTYWKRQKGVDEVQNLDLLERWGGDLSDTSAIGSESRLNPRDRWAPPCKQLWDDFSILWDGRVSPCCVDGAYRRMIVGNVRNESLQEIRSGEKYQNLRKLHLEGRRHQHPICKSCLMYTLWV